MAERRTDTDRQQDCHDRREDTNGIEPLPRCILEVAAFILRLRPTRSEERHGSIIGRGPPDLEWDHSDGDASSRPQCEDWAMNDGRPSYDESPRRLGGLILVCAFSLAIWISSVYVVTQLF
jgi:hypothetical protein